METNGKNQDDLIMRQQEEIQQNIAAASDLVSEKLPLTVLQEEFANDEAPTKTTCNCKENLLPDNDEEEGRALILQKFLSSIQ